MYSGPPIFSQVMDFLPPKAFQRCVERYRGDFSVKRFSCHDQFRTMAFAQLTYRESLLDSEVCLRAQSNKLYHICNHPTLFNLFHGDFLPFLAKNTRFCQQDNRILRLS